MPVDAFQNTFAGNPLDRASERRGDAAWIAERLEAPDTVAVALWNGKPLTRGSPPELALLPGAMAAELAGGDERLLFLGLDGDAAYFAVDLEGAADPAQGPLEGQGEFQELRAVSLQLPVGQAGMAATARGLFEWRRRHRHCAQCGQPTEAADAGWRRRCPVCRAEHFPRTDPVVIMLPTFGERCLMGRQATWPEGRFSALAGFMEPGESIEEACAREIQEESGLRAVRVRYHSTQPWPFPASLMIGLIAEVDGDQAAPDQTELSEVRWFTRAEARALLEGGLEGVSAPTPAAIAHQLIRAWAYEAS